MIIDYQTTFWPKMASHFPGDKQVPGPRLVRAEPMDAFDSAQRPGSECGGKITCSSLSPVPHGRFGRKREKSGTMNAVRSELFEHMPKTEVDACLDLAHARA